jgi:phosphatidylserine/phosphatidylglycerophosphate/cardiolipin synthase-like enzyme
VRLFESATETLDVVNPYVTDRGMIRRMAQAAERGVRVRLFVPANVNRWECGLVLQSHHARLLDVGVRIVEHPAMLHAKAFVRDGEEVIVGTCNLEAWSLRRFFEIDLQLWSGESPHSSRSASARRPRPCPDQVSRSPARRGVSRRQRRPRCHHSCEP